MSTEAKATATVGVKVQCESCRHVYEYKEIVVAVRSSWSDSRSADDLATECEKDLVKRLHDCLQRKSVRDLGFKKCPSCTHIQAWMRQSREEHREMIFVILSVVLALGTAIFINTRELIPKGLWYWLSIPIIVMLGVLYYGSARIISGLIRGSPESQPRQHLSTGPLEVRMIANPEVVVERREVY